MKKQYNIPVIETTELTACVIMQTEGTSTVVNNNMTPIPGGVD